MKIYRLQNSERFTEELAQILEQCKNEAAKIVFSAGTYIFQKGIVLTKEHQNLSFEADGEVHFRGAVPLTNWRKPEAEEKLREQVLVCDLKETGSPKISGFTSRGFGRYMVPGHSELFMDGEPLKLSQYPKGTDFARITGLEHGEEKYPGMMLGPLEEGFYCADERLKAWQKNEDIWVLGYWIWDWAPTVENMDSYDSNSGKILMKAPYGMGNYCKGQRIRFYNIPEEVREPGDYCIDHKNQKIYLYPQEAEKTVWISCLQEPFFQIEGSREISFKDITFEMTCGVAVEANYCEGLSIKDCTLKNIGSTAINVLEGHDIHIENNTIHDCGDSGVILCGGNRCTLEPMRANVDNNHIYRIGKWTKCYQVGIHLHGVGMNARHNLIHDLPHTGIMFWGNEIHIEDNEIYRVLLESGDAGAIYTGRDYTYRGNRVCHNYIHHVGNSCDITNGIYNDDCVSGTVMKDNYLEEIENGMLLGGGRDFLVENNVFVNCDTAIYFDDRGVHKSEQWMGMVFQTLKPRFYHIEHYPYGNIMTDRYDVEKARYRHEYASGNDEVYLKKYPELAVLDQMFQGRKYTSNIGIPGSALVKGNVFLPRSVFENGKRQYSFDNIIKFWNFGNELNFETNHIGIPDELTDAAWSDLTVRRDNGAELCGYVDHGMDTIGLLEMERTQNPARVKTSVNYDKETNTVNVGIRNQKDSKVTGTLKFDIKGEIILEEKEIPFTLDGKEEVWFSVKAKKADAKAKMEVYSDVPGVRPCRLRMR